MQSDHPRLWTLSTLSSARDAPSMDSVHRRRHGITREGHWITGDFLTLTGVSLDRTKNRQIPSRQGGVQEAVRLAPSFSCHLSVFWSTWHLSNLSKMYQHIEVGFAKRFENWCQPAVSSCHFQGIQSTIRVSWTPTEQVGFKVGAASHPPLSRGSQSLRSVGPRGPPGPLGACKKSPGPGVACREVQEQADWQEKTGWETLRSVHFWLFLWSKWWDSQS